MKKRNLFTIVALFIFTGLIAQSGCSGWTKEKSEEWFKKGEWLGGLTMKPHSSIDILEFAKLYHKNSRIWDKAFEFLRNTNLDTISPGKYQILGDSVFASITESSTKTMDQSKWEFHKKYTDIQLVAKGKEKIGVTPVENVVITDAFNETKDIAFGTYDKGDYYDVEPGVFLLFFPKDGHRPGLRLEDCDKNKKVVIKVLTH